MSTTTGITIPAELDLEPGVIVGEYVIAARLGAGTFGTVYRATHPLIGKLVAIKVLARKYSVDPEMIERFVAEARAVNQIRHRNIIDIFSFGQLGDGRAYYVMELLDGETLDGLLHRQGRLTVDTAVPIPRGAARAPDAAHAKGIAHRDLKPDNIFLATADGDDPFPKLLDFGIAKLLTETTGPKTRTGVAMGTPYYMSPEQARGRNVDHRTDYYAYGVLAYQLLTGAVPFDGDDYMSILMKQVSEEAVPATQLVPDLPPRVDEAIGWLMRKSPGERPPSLAEAMRVLSGSANVTSAVETMAPVTTTTTGSGRNAAVAIVTMRGYRCGPWRRDRAPAPCADVVVGAARAVAAPGDTSGDRGGR